MTGWIDRQRRTVAEVATALGRGGSERQGWPCPACGEEKRDGRRGAVVAGPGGGWHCYRCSAVGDGLDYLSYAICGKRLRDGDDSERRRVQDWCGEAAPALPHREAPPARHADVSAFWTACYPCPNADPFMVARRLTNVPPNLARFTPPAPSSQDTWPEWWPRGRADTWRLVARGWAPTPDGFAPVNLHGRAIVEPPEFDGRRIKTLWGKGLDARGLVFWNERPTADAQLVVVAEGITDWLALACWASAQSKAPGIVVFGLTSGGADAFVHIPIPDTADLILATDDAPAGDDYAARVASHYRHRPVHRAHPSRFLDSRPKATK